MVARRFNEADVDFEAIDGDLAKLAPPKLTLKDVLDRLRERMLEQRAEGRHGGADTRSADGKGHRNRGKKPEGLPRQGRAAGTQDGEVDGECLGFGGRQGSVLSAMARRIERGRAVSLEER